ncbi:hypothetical protein [Thaumasiovibrio sp. DFM-14]|uniref:hypothetical protein n=1 Tax=Thaumasiovibrio sp. DFM-14 TaxID=3384792 RepID=UPI0039A1B65F
MTLRLSLGLLLSLLFGTYCYAAPSINEKQSDDSGFYLSSSTTKKHNFDMWQLNSGYSYSVSSNLQLYLSTSITAGNEHLEPERGIASGIKYGFTPRFSIESALTTSLNSPTETPSKQTAPLGFEVSSRYRLTELVDVHATLDIEQIESQYVLGIGYRF